MQLITLITSLCATWIALVLLKPIALRAGLLDKPGGRKQHKGAVPLIGGLAIFTGVATASLLTISMDTTLNTWLLCALGVVLLGVADDAEDLSVRLRVAVQIMLTFALCIGTGLYLENLGDLLGLGAIHLNVLGYLLTIVAVVGAINCFNMIDGIDGLLGSVSLVSLGSMAILFNTSGHEMALIISAIFIVALIPYLMNNLLIRPFKQKIFMGDAGSMLIGMTIIWLLIEGSQGNATHAFRPVTALWLIALPLMDMVRVTLHRIRSHRSPFAAGRDHLHHILQDAGLTPRQTLIAMTLFALCLAMVGVVSEGQQSNEGLMFLSFLLVFAGYQLLVNQLLQTEKGSLKNGLKQVLQTLTARKVFAKSESN
jgi:UDP-GlcNAc:undecaprenyl-phosphate GlcNAc-1-phosphate transferase